MLTLIASLALAAIAPTPTTPTPDRIMIGLRQSGLLAGRPVRADRVVEDSRCPMNARCVWAGRATVRLTLRDGQRKRHANLTLGEAIPFAGGKLALISVSPERMAGAQPKRPAPYQFLLEFQR